MKRILYLFIILLSMGLSTGCMYRDHDDDGPLENLAEDVDEAVDELDD